MAPHHISNNTSISIKSFGHVTTFKGIEYFVLIMAVSISKRYQNVKAEPIHKAGLELDANMKLICRLSTSTPTQNTQTLDRKQAPLVSDCTHAVWGHSWWIQIQNRWPSSR